MKNLLTKILYVSAFIAPISQSTLGQQKESATTTLDYGYGTADAPVVKIGSQVWMGKNLNVDRFANGDPIPEAKTNDEWKRAGVNDQPAWCYHNNDPANGRTYGKLYNWHVVNDPRGLAPKGWHIPSDGEWTTVTTYLGGEATAGTSLKSTNGWENKGNGNNKSGMAGLPGGNRGIIGEFYALGKEGNWWSSSESDSGAAWSRGLFDFGGSVDRDSGNKSGGYSVRCLKD